MKTNKLRLLCATLVALVVGMMTVSVHADGIVILNLDDGVPVQPEILPKGKVSPYMKSAIASVNAFNIGVKEEGLRIASLVPSTSPNLNQSRAYAMAGMSGASVPMDRTSNPSAWYLVPENGLQLYDFAVTTMTSWLGKTFVTNAATANEHGHRIVIHVAGRYPVSKYWCRLSTSVTNLGGAFFSIATNTSNGAEILFNSNFIGIDEGANGILESAPNPVTGVLQQGGDDHVYSNNERPSQVTYQWWCRLGSTAQVNISQSSGFDSLMAEFAKSNQWLKAELVVPGESEQILDTRKVIAAQHRMESWEAGENVRLNITGGQTTMMYAIETTANLNPPVVWTLLRHQAYQSDSAWLEPKTPGMERYFRARATGAIVP